MERWMIIYLLPLEVWMDIFVFPWISREEFGLLVARIGNFRFAEHAQFYLHEWGKRKLGNLAFEEDGLCKYVNRFRKRYRLEYPQSAMPENIKSFDFFHIRHFDANTLDFLTKITPLLTGVEIRVAYISPDHLENIRTILNTLAPMLDGIRSLYCNSETAFSLVKEQFFRENEKLAKLKRLDVYFECETGKQENVDFVMNWLALSETDGPRLFEFTSVSNAFYEQILKAIREQFIAAKSPRTFTAVWKHSGGHAAEFHLENGIGEALHGEWTHNEHKGDFQITRHGADHKTKEAREWIIKMTMARNGDRKICIYDATVGQIDAVPQMVVPRVDEEQDDQQKSCSSKDT